MRIQIEVELLIIIIIVLMLAIWMVWFRISAKRNLKKYNPNDDKGRIGEEKRKREIAELGEGSSEALGRESSFTRLAKPTKRTILEDAGVNKPRKNSPSPKSTPRRSFNIFRRKK